MVFNMPFYLQLLERAQHKTHQVWSLQAIIAYQTSYIPTRELPQDQASMFHRGASTTGRKEVWHCFPGACLTLKSSSRQKRKRIRLGGRQDTQASGVAVLQSPEKRRRTMESMMTATV